MNRINRAYIQGTGIVAHIGEDPATVYRNVREQNISPQNITLKSIKEEPSVLYYSIENNSFGNKKARLFNIIENVINQAVAEANLTENQLRSIPLFIGSSSLDVSISEDEYMEDIRQGLTSHPVRTSGYGKLTSFIQERFRIQNTAYTFNTSCTSSVNAYAFAASLIESGEIDRALVLGIEVLNEITVYGFNALRLISPDGLRPFSSDRNGTVLGEGTSAIILGKEPPSDHRGVHYAGSSNTCDTHSVTGANPDGSSTHLVMQRALTNSNLSVSDITAIKAHGTSSFVNDQAEANGMEKLFGKRIPPTTVLKPFLGHTLGACGTNELVIIHEFLKNNHWPAGPAITNPDPDLNNFTTLERNFSVSPGYFMLNYYGFGGNNTSVIIGNI